MNREERRAAVKKLTKKGLTKERRPDLWEKYIKTK